MSFHENVFGMPSPAQSSSPTPKRETSPDSRPADRNRRRRRWWLWYLLTGAMIALLFGGQRVAGTIVKSQARECIAKRDPDGALQWLKWSAALDRRDAEAEFLRARAYRKLGEFNLVREHLSLAFKQGYSVTRLEREQTLALAQSGQLHEAEPQLSGLLTDPQGDAPEICEAFVHGFIMNRRFGDAFEMLTPWIADYPGSPQPYYIRGHLHVQLQQYKLAEADLRKALELDPRHEATTFELGDVLEQLHRPEEALTYYIRAGKYPRFEMLAGIGESRCLKILGRNDEARAVILRIIEKHPQEPLAHQSLGQIELEAGKYEDALKHLDLAAVKLGYDSELRNARGTALRGLRRLDEARREFEYVSESSRALGRAADLRDKVQAEPTDFQSRYEIGKIFLKYAPPQEGVIWLQSVFNYQPHHQGAHQALADYYTSREKEDPKFRELAERHRKEAAAAPRDEDSTHNGNR